MFDIIQLAGESPAFPHRAEGRGAVVSSEPIPGGGPDGEQPVPAAPDGVPGSAASAAAGEPEWDAAADLQRLLDDVEAGREQVPPEDEQVPGPRVWFSLAGTTDPAEVDVAGLAEGGPVNTMAPGPVLAAVADMACDPAVVTALTDDQLLGLAGAGRRLTARGAWVTQAAVAEFAARRVEPDPKKAGPFGFTRFAAGELAPELVITTAAAEEAMARARAARRLPACRALLREGMISEFALTIITDATFCLTGDGAAEADKLLAAAAPALTPGQLRAMCTRTVLMIDPAAARRRKESAARGAKVTRFQEYSGNAALCGRALPPDQVLASSAHIDACARALRQAGVPGTLEQLRAAAFLDLTRGRDPLDRLTAAPDSTAGQPAGGSQTRDPDRGARHGHQNDAGQDGPDDSDSQLSGDLDGGPDRPDDDRCDDDSGPDGGGPGTGDRPRPGSRPRAGDAAPVRATITLLVPAGTLLGWSNAPGEIGGFGLLDPQTTRDMTQAAAAHPETRWCVTVIGDDGTATAHGCAPGPRPWTPSPRDGPGPPPSHAEQAAQVTALLRRLRVQLAPIAQGTCDHRDYSDRYVISRKVKHLIKARTIKCTAPCCNRPAADADADHTIPWPDGPSCQCNLGAPCRYHHRNKQAPGWRLEQPEPGIMVWHTPSGRTHTTRPTKYMI